MGLLKSTYRYLYSNSIIRTRSWGTITYLLGNLYELQQEFLSISEFSDVSIEGSEHLQLVNFWQKFEQPAQLFSTNIIVATVTDQLDNVLVTAPKLLQEYIHVQASLPIQKYDLLEDNK